MNSTSESVQLKKLQQNQKFITKQNRADEAQKNAHPSKKKHAQETKGAEKQQAQKNVKN